MRRPHLVLIVLLSCGKPGHEGPALSAAESEFFELMESNDKLSERLQAAVEKGAWNEECNRRLETIRKNMERARDLRVGKDEAMRQTLEREFGQFLATLQELRSKDWREEGRILWRRLEAGCSRCHDQFKED